MKPAKFFPQDDVNQILEDVLAASVADETEIVWLQRRRGLIDSRCDARDFIEIPRLTVLVRVVESGRLGWFRTETSAVSELKDATRQAQAMAKVQVKVKSRPLLPTNIDAINGGTRLHDRQISRLDLRSARDLCRHFCHNGEALQMSWSESRLVIFNSHGMRRSAVANHLGLDVMAGEGVHGCGRAAAAARTLKALDIDALYERAYSCHAEPSEIGSDAVGTLPQGPVPVLLSPEAMIELLNLLNSYALSGRAFLDGSSFLSQHRNIQVFDRRFNLRDDGTHEQGLAFPFDLEGSPKRPLDLIVEGTPSTPALNRYQGVEAGLESTAQSVGGQDALFGNLFLMPGEVSEEDLLKAADGGIRIGWLDPPSCYEPSHLQMRAVARSVRRIRDGRLAEALPDFVWQASLLHALARLAGVGKNSVVRATGTTPLGGISAPAIVLAEAEGFRPLS